MLVAWGKRCQRSLPSAGETLLMMAIRTAHMFVSFSVGHPVGHCQGNNRDLSAVILAGLGHLNPTRDKWLYDARRARRMILPVVVRGNSSRKVTWLGVS